MKRPHVEFYSRHWGLSGAEYRWRLRAPNGRIIASGEGFSSMAKARASFAAVAKYSGPAVERPAS